jgi:tetratricopeptide (TPR) repeat protein
LGPLLSLFLSGASNELSLFKADAWLELGEPDKAIAVYLLLLRDSPDDVLLVNRTGFAYFKSGRFHEALPYFQNAVLRDPAKAAYWNNCGATLARLRRYPSAESNYREALKRAADNPRYLYNLGVVCFRQRKYRESADAMMSAWKKDRKYVESRFDRDAAIKEVRRMRKENPDDTELAEIEQLLEKRASSERR